ncbi:MAG: HD domain-containing phosphohydrolase [Methylococcaceae bacterium]|jgi:response regulator RpfG family c-di-GMP phosphodiesterase
MINNKILCVDDEPNVLEGLKRQLRKYFDVTTATGSLEALTLIKQTGPFAVVVSDYNMPKMNGTEFLSLVKNFCPDTISIMLTGRADLDVAVNALHQGKIFRFLNKPVSPELLIQSITDALEQHRLIIAEQELKVQLNQANRDLSTLNAKLETTVEERTNTLRRLYRFVSNLNALNSPQAVASLVVNTTASMLNCLEVSLWMYEPEHQLLRMSAANFLGNTENLSLSVNNTVIGKHFNLAEITVYDSSMDSEQTGFDTQFLGELPILFVPLISENKTTGLLVISAPTRGTYQQEDISVAHALAHSTAIALANYQHRAERDETQDAVIMALAILSESRDSETGGHLLRLKVYCRLLCESLAKQARYHALITADFIADIVRSSPLHDIGKVGIPDHILKKPGKHTVEEFAIMKTHATIGGDTLKTVLDQCRYQGFIKTGMEIAYGHHERWDGSGYPNGLKGEEIPLSARILALADVFDALTTKRTYKPAFSFAQTKQIILEGKGSHFDPDIVDAFLYRELEFIATANALAENLA